MTDRLIARESALEAENVLLKKELTRLQGRPRAGATFVFIFASIIGWLRDWWRGFTAAEDAPEYDDEDEEEGELTPYELKACEIIALGKAKCGYCEHYDGNIGSTIARCELRKEAKAAWEHEHQVDPRIPQLAGKWEGPCLSVYADETCRKWSLDLKVLDDPLSTEPLE